MPNIVAVLPLILSAVSAATAVGEGIYQGVEQSNAQSDAAAAAKRAQQAQANQAALAKQQAITATQGQAQAQTGGSLTDTGFQDFAAQLAGYPGAGNTGTQSTAQQVNTSQQTQNAQTGGQDITSLLKQLQGGQGGNISGGSGSGQPPSPQQGFQLANPFVGA